MRWCDSPANKAVLRIFERYKLADARKERQGHSIGSLAYYQDLESHCSLSL